MSDILLPETGCSLDELVNLGHLSKEEVEKAALVFDPETLGNKAPITGPSDAELAVIGDGPGRIELREQKPLVGPTGKFLDKMLDEKGVNPDNIVRGNIYETFEPVNEERTLELGQERLKELEKYERLASILAISRIAGTGLTGAPAKLPMSEMRKIEHTTDKGVPVHTTYHPSAIMRSGQRKSKYYPALEEDVMKAVDDLARKKQAAAEEAKGIPDRKNYGDVSDLPTDKLVDWIIQKHLAQRAGKHYDIRMGNKDTGLYSWATRKGPLPAHGQKQMIVQQPLHSHKYKDFEGTIPSGYGAGTVSKYDEGKVLVTKASPNSIHFTLASKKYPERFVLFRPEGWRTGDKRSWLMMNTTPTKEFGFGKPKIKKVDAAKVDALIAGMKPGDALEPKVDGASALVSFLKDNAIELSSYRKSKVHPGPLMYTERVMRGIPKAENLPKHLQGSVLRGEIYGVQKQRGKDKIVDLQHLGGLLNSKLDKSIQTQDREGIKLKTMVHDIARYGKRKLTDPNKIPRPERLRMINEILQYMPKDTFHATEPATTPDAARALESQVAMGKHPLTSEGVVFHPNLGEPKKMPVTPEANVYISGIFPGEGKYKGTHAGGFHYALDQGGKTVGNVGTGLTDETRRLLMENPNDYLGRVARIRYKQQFPSGAFRAPSFLALEESAPTKLGHLTKEAGKKKPAKKKKPKLPVPHEPASNGHISQYLPVQPHQGLATVLPPGVDIADVYTSYQGAFHDSGFPSDVALRIGDKPPAEYKNIPILGGPQGPIPPPMNGKVAMLGRLTGKGNKK